MAQQVVRTSTEMPSVNTYGKMATVDLYFEATGSDEGLPISSGSSTSVVGVLNDFWTSLSGSQSAKIGAYLSPDVSRSSNAGMYTITDITAHLDGSAAGPPIAVFSWTVPTGLADGPLAPGLAMCLGYRRAYGSDVERTGTIRPRARDRGRFYIGPLDLYTSKNKTDGSGFGGQIAALPLADLAQAADALFATHNPGSHDQFNCVQWSRKNASVANVAFYFVDTGYAYQRRREQEEQARVHTWVSV